MATYRDGDPRLRIDTLEAKLAERDASLVARDTELVELRAEIARSRSEGSLGRGSHLAPWLAVGTVITAAALAVACVGLHFETVRVRSVAAAQEARFRAARVNLEKRFEDFGDTKARAAMARAFDDAARDAAKCGQLGAPTGEGVVTIVFDPIRGAVESATIAEASRYRSSVQACIEESFLRVQVDPFKAPRLTVARSFTIP